MSIELKIKAKVLAIESKIIKREEKWALKAARATVRGGYGDGTAQYSTHAKLYGHRTRDVRWEARATNLARAYLRGADYKSVENKRVHGFPAVVLSSTLRMITTYGKATDNTTKDALLHWIHK